VIDPESTRRAATATRPLDPERAAFTDGLRLLARRDVSTAQLRDRLVRRGHPAPAIDSALARLTREGALDDRRVAAGRARTELLIRGRGRARARRQIEALGIDADTAREAVDEVAAGLDDRTLVDRALDRRLRSRPAAPLDTGTVARLYRYLVSQGFPPDAVSAALRTRARGHLALPDDE
jgi:regulatory protein